MQTSKNNCKRCRNTVASEVVLQKRINGEIPWPMAGKKLTEEHKASISNGIKGENNPMYNKSFYDIWLDKYGKDIADLKLKEFKKKISTATSGQNNPMFGKPSPGGSGNGWQGWYKGWRFRSLLELSFIIKVAERFNFKWESAETQELKIQYLENGKARNYFADILLNNKWLIEIKPKSLSDTKICNLKKDAAIIFCNKRNMRYKIIDPPRLTDTEIKNMIETGIIMLDIRYSKIYNNEQKDNNRRMRGIR